MQDRGHRLLDGRIGGIIELQQAGKAGLKIRLRTIEAGERNHGIPASKIGSEDGFNCTVFWRLTAPRRGFPIESHTHSGY
jgi:hypothetical protein